MSIVFKDFGTAYLAAPLTVGGLSITVDSAASLPILTAGDYFYLVLQKYSDRSYVEIVKVIATAGKTLTIIRGQAGTSIRAFAEGDYAELRLTTDALTEYISQNIGTKMDKKGGGDFEGLYRFLGSSVGRLDLVRTSDDVSSSVVVDYSASEGHRTIICGPSGHNAETPSVLLRPNGLGSSVGQARIGPTGILDVVSCVMRGVQLTDDGAAVRYDELRKYVPVLRTINKKPLSEDITLSAGDVRAAPAGFGLGEGPFVNRGDANRIFLNGWQDYNADGGDINGPESYGVILHSGNKGNGDSYNGWSSQFFQGSSGALYYRNNKAGGSFNGTPWEVIYTSVNNPLNDAGIYDGQPRDFNALGAGFRGLIPLQGSTNAPPPSTWGDGHVYVEVKRVYGGEIVQRTLPFRDSETTASRVRNASGVWSGWKIDQVYRNIGYGGDLNNYWGPSNFGAYSVDGANNPNWPWSGTAAGTLVVDGVGGFTRQQAWRIDSADTIFRTRGSDGTWSAWNSVYNSGYFPKRTSWENFVESKDMVVGGLAWTNYGNNHAIIDVSKGVAPNGVSVDKTNSEFPWGPNHPTLVGWNGSNTYGVRVDSARVADIVHNNGIVANGNGNAWSIVNGNIVEIGGFVGASNSAPQRVNFPFRLATVFTVQITPYTEGTGRGGGAEANDVVDIIDHDGFTFHSGQAKTPCTFMWVAKGIRA